MYQSLDTCSFLDNLDILSGTNARGFWVQTAIVRHNLSDDRLARRLMPQPV
ncbi:MAG: hypothetical protein SW833_23875 [Cyanobacteriota bacterium]|nr:hypothetical protein [Cyanobacteriota bacterium]